MLNPCEWSDVIAYPAIYANAVYFIQGTWASEGGPGTNPPRILRDNRIKVSKVGSKVEKYRLLYIPLFHLVILHWIISFLRHNNQNWIPKVLITTIKQRSKQAKRTSRLASHILFIHLLYTATQHCPFPQEKYIPYSCLSRVQQQTFSAITHLTSLPCLYLHWRFYP